MPNDMKIKVKEDYFKSEKFVKKMLKKNKEQLSRTIDAMKTFDNYPHMQMTNLVQMVIAIICNFYVWKHNQKKY